MSCLLDTSVIVDYLRGRFSPAENASILEKFETGCAVSAITVAEYAEGAYRSSRPEHNLKIWKTLLSAARLDVLPLDEDVAFVYGKLQAGLAKLGRRMGGLDALVAATALQYNLTLVTQDRDFRQVPDLRLVLLPTARTPTRRR